MRELSAQQITDAVRRLCIQANCYLPEDVRRCIASCRAREPWPQAQEILGRIQENDQIASQRQQPICQDTGMACVFVTVGQEVHITGDLTAAIHEGVRQGYQQGFLRKSVVGDPLRRVNTGDNTPAILHVQLVPGDTLKLTVAPKGFGSENMSRVYMLTPAQGVEGVLDAVVDTVVSAGACACPPCVVGVGIGGTMEQAALLAKAQLLRPLGQPSPDPELIPWEQEALRRINRSGIGPMGLGGNTTALAVYMAQTPTHIAGLPVAINMQCHACRHATRRL